MAGFADFNDVATIWAERNLLLRNTIWPRKAYLEVLAWEHTSDADATLAGDKAEVEDEDRDPQQTAAAHAADREAQRR